MAELSEEYAGRARIGLINVDADRDLAAKFGVQSIPHLVFFKGGQVVESTGLTSGDMQENYDDLARRLDQLTAF